MPSAAPSISRSWSPSCDRIVFQSERNGNTDIYMVNADGSNLKRLTTDAADDWHPSWSPTADVIVFQSKCVPDLVDGDLMPWEERDGIDDDGDLG